MGMNHSKVTWYGVAGLMLTLVFLPVSANLYESKATGKLCKNRGGRGGNPSKYSMMAATAPAPAPPGSACASAVKGKADCGFAFNYAAHSGWCDCVPKSASKTTIGACQP